MQRDCRLVWAQCLECSDQVQLALALLKHVDVGKPTSWHQQSLLHCRWVHTTGTRWHRAATCIHNNLSVHRPHADILYSHPPSYKTALSYVFEFQLSVHFYIAYLSIMPGAPGLAHKSGRKMCIICKRFLTLMFELLRYNRTHQLLQL